MISCTNRTHDAIDIVWKDSIAKAVSLPANVTDNIPRDSLQDLIRISIKDDSTHTPVIGHFTTGKNILFEPLLAFGAGMTYEIFVRNQPVGTFSIPANHTAAAGLRTSYPQTDTVPENLLKIYLVFSQPMQQGRSKNFMTLIRNNTDTLHNVFLDLQPELWNKDNTVLTIWLDPGRIKRGLQPNEKLGNPLHAYDHYQLIVDKGWRDANGHTTPSNYRWTFVATHRDSTSPDITKWTIASVPGKQNKEIAIDLHESLDHFLLTESISIFDRQGNMIAGKCMLGNKDAAIRFMADQPMTPGTYTLRVQSRLEDLAGNNCNRLFERDLSTSKEPSTQLYHDRSFVVQ